MAWVNNVIANASPWTTGDPVGDLTSYGIGAIIAATAWRLFRWWRADQKQMDGEHEEQLARHRRNQAVLLAHITLLSVEIARLGGNVPEAPRLEE